MVESDRVEVEGGPRLEKVDRIETTTSNGRGWWWWWVDLGVVGYEHWGQGAAVFFD